MGWGFLYVNALGWLFFLVWMSLFVISLPLLDPETLFPSPTTLSFIPLCSISLLFYRLGLFGVGKGGEEYLMPQYRSLSRLCEIDDLWCWICLLFLAWRNVSGVLCKKHMLMFDLMVPERIVSGCGCFADRGGVWWGGVDGRVEYSGTI